MLSRSGRTWIMINSRNGLAARLSGEILEKYDVKDIEPPNEGLIMIKTRDTARGARFFLGEVLVTEAKVRIGGAAGIGIVRGSEPELAYNLAVVDAAFNAGLPETEGWTKIFVEEEQSARERIGLEQGRIMETKVSFETMDNPL